MSIISIVVQAAPASRVAPDIPNENIENVDKHAVAGLVEGVSEGWCCHLADKNTLALFIPSQLFSSTLSRENFVELLEYCEEHLKVKRVLACFNKFDINPSKGIPRTLKCIGFSLLSPDRYPSGINKTNTFVMEYNI